MKVFLRGLRILLAVLLVGVPATAVTVVVAPAAHAASIHAMTYLLSSRLESGSCLSMASAAGAPPATAACAYPATTAPQRFNFLTDPDSGGTWVASNGSSRCVVAQGSSALGRATCRSDPAALWDVSWAEAMTVRLVNRATGLCLATGSGRGSPPVQSPCTLLSAEWFASPLLDRYQLQPTHTSMCLDIWNNDGGLQETDKAQQWTCLGPNQTNQMWSLELQALPRWEIVGAPYASSWHVVPPMYELHPMHNEDMCLVHDQSYTDGHEVHQGACGASSGWLFYPFDLTPGNETFQIQAVTAHAINFDVCLDVHLGAGASNGAKVQVWHCLGAAQANQLWHPVKLN